MILDKNTLFADDLDYDGSPDYVDLQNANVGPGKPIKCFAIGNGSLAGATGLAITDCATSGGSYTSGFEITATAAELNAGIEFNLPNNIRRYVKVALAGTPSAGAWTAGVILEGFQSAG